MVPAPDPFDTGGRKIFTDHDIAGKDWRQEDTVSTIVRHIADIDLWHKEKPFCLNLPLPEGQPRSNFIGSNHDGTSICNVRGRERDFTLDQHGFAFTKLPAFKASFNDVAEIETVYLREMEEFIKMETNADEVFVFDYTVGCPGDPSQHLLTLAASSTRAIRRRLCGKVLPSTGNSRSCW